MIFVFDNTRDVITAEKAVSSRGVAGVKVIPSPVTVSHGCGMALAVDRDVTDMVKDILSGQNIKFDLHGE